MGPRVELSAASGWDTQRGGLGVRARARRCDVHRRRVRQAIGSPLPPDRKRPARPAPVREAVAGWIDEMLREDLAAPRKQRHTARRGFERLRDEQDAQVSYSTVAKSVQRRRAGIAAAARAEDGGVDGFVPQAKEPGAEAEVDFGDVLVELAGHLAKCYQFAYRLSFAGKACHRVYACQAQEAFLEGHVTAFEATGGVPWRHVRYDNLSPAVAKVLTGRSRTETARWLSFRSWYGFSAFYCEPGQAGAHEKGGVEGEIGRFRRRWMVPVPKVSSLAELNARLAEADAADDARHISYRAATVGEDFAAEQRFLLPLPAEPFDCAATAWPRVDRYARISLGKCRYSVPARLIDTRVRGRVSANELRIFDRPQQVAAHPRLAAARAAHLEPDPYPQIPVRNAAALPRPPAPPPPPAPAAPPRPPAAGGARGGAAGPRGVAYPPPPRVPRSTGPAASSACPPSAAATARSPPPPPASRPATRASWSSCCRSNATTASSAARPGWSATPPFPAKSGWRTSTTPPTPTCPPRSSTPSPSPRGPPPGSPAA